MWLIGNIRKLTWISKAMTNSAYANAANGTGAMASATARTAGQRTCAMMKRIKGDAYTGTVKDQQKERQRLYE